MAYTIVDPNEIEARRGVFRPLREPLGVTAFGINQLELPAGAEGFEHSHDADGQEEVYVIIRGGGTLVVDGEEAELSTGDYVFVSPDATRKIVAGDEGVAWIGIGSQPGAYKPRQ